MTCIFFQNKIFFFNKVLIIQNNYNSKTKNQINKSYNLRKKVVKEINIYNLNTQKNYFKVYYCYLNSNNYSLNKVYLKIN